MDSSQEITQGVGAEKTQLMVLCVDDEKNILRALTRVFRTESFGVLTATSGMEGLAILQKTGNIGLILSDQRMPEMSGSAFLKAAKALSPDIPRIILTGYTDATDAIDAINQGGAERYLKKPWDEEELRLVVRDGLQRYQLTQENLRLAEVVNRQKGELEEWNTNLKSRVLQQTAVIRRQIAEANQKNVHLAEAQQQQEHPQKFVDSIVQLFAGMMDQRHSRFSKHSRKVAALAEAMAGKLNVAQPQCEEIRYAALLHNIGLICVSDRLLSKAPELLSTDELSEYRTHAVKGQELVDGFEELQGIGVLIRHHHEEFDGGGFPDGLVGERIPLGARIISLANFIDHAFTAETGIDAKYQVTRKIAAGMGTLFDPDLSAAANLAVKEILVDHPVPRVEIEQELQLKDLRIGMVLTRDIYNLLGLLIVERGTVTADALEYVKKNRLTISPSRVVYVQKSRIVG